MGLVNLHVKKGVKLQWRTRGIKAEQSSASERTYRRVSGRLSHLVDDLRLFAPTFGIPGDSDYCLVKLSSLVSLP